MEFLILCRETAMLKLTVVKFPVGAYK